MSKEIQPEELFSKEKREGIKDFIDGYKTAEKEYKEKISKIYSKYLSMTSEHHYEIYEELNQDRLKHER